jgi:exonuclease III
MIAGGFSDSSRIAKEGEAKTTFTDMNSENSGIIFDYVFVSDELKNSVETYTVCPAKVDGQWVSDHNAIVATIVLRKA